MKSVVLFLFCAVLGTSVSAQVLNDLPDNLVLTCENSVRPDEVKVFEATGTIRFESGFISKGSLRTAIVAKRNPNSDIPENITLECVAFPNPGSDLIRIKGSFRQTLLSIIDLSGGPVMETMLGGDNPAIDVSCLTKGEYILKSKHFSIRWVKE
jgi:hypothetical protein